MRKVILAVFCFFMLTMSARAEDLTIDIHRIDPTAWGHR